MHFKIFSAKAPAQTLLSVALFALLLTSGCREREPLFAENRGGKPIHLPSGWKLGPQTTMLARSYPMFEWISLILEGTGKKLLFSTPLPKPLPQSSRRRYTDPYLPILFPFQGENRRQNLPPMEQYGIKFSLISKKSFALKIVLAGEKKATINGSPHCEIKIEKHRKWLYFSIPFCKFFSEKNSERANFNHFSRIEFWSNYPINENFRTTLTITPPKLYKIKKNSCAKYKKSPIQCRTSSSTTSTANSRPTATTLPSRKVQTSNTATSRPTARTKK